MTYRNYWIDYMREELDVFLCVKYPEIFKNRETNGSAMHYGFSCGEGWFNIIDSLCASIQDHINEHLAQIELYDQFVAAGKEIPDWMPKLEPVPQAVAAQVKEKFGTLRFYCDGGDSKIRGMIKMAEAMSAVTCEECGAPGELRSGSWVRTLCKKHAKKKRK